MKALIIGGGIGGLTLALMLHSKGFECQVFEASDNIKELGVGVNILPPAVKELFKLGMQGDLDASAIRTRELILMTKRGQEVWRDLRGLEAGLDTPQFSVHRGRLQGIIFKTLIDRLGPEAVKTKQVCVGYSQDGSQVTAHFAPGAEIASATGDFLIGADGIHSAIRHQMFPDEPELRWNGVMMWRGAVDTDIFLDGRTQVIAGGIDCKVVLYPIAPSSTPGKALTNWVVCYKAGNPGDPVPLRQDWDHQATCEDVMDHVGPVTIDPAIIDYQALIRLSSTYYKFPMCDRDPLPSWVDGRVTILGDAAHPMYPVGSNGATQAIMDARKLVDFLAGTSDVSTSLKEYESARRPICAELVIMNRTGGPESIIEEVEARAPDGFSNLDDVITLAERAAILSGYAKKSGFAKS